MGTIKPIAFDTETALFGTNNMSPKLACLTYAYIDSDNKLQSKIVDSLNAEKAIEKLLDRDDVKLVGANTAFDMGVILRNYPRLKHKIFQKYEKNLVSDVILRNALGMIERGKQKCYLVGLAGLRKQQSDVVMEKDLWRMRYGELIGVPLSKWPEGAVKYAVTDAEETLKAYTLQKSFKNEDLQCKASFSLELKKVEGFSADMNLASSLTERKEKEKKELLDKVLGWDAYRMETEYVTEWNSKTVYTEEEYERFADLGIYNVTEAKIAKNMDKVIEEEDFLRSVGYVTGYNKKGQLQCRNITWLKKNTAIMTNLLAMGVLERVPKKYSLRYKMQLFEINDVLEANGLPTVKKVVEPKKNTKIVQAMVRECYAGSGFTVPMTKGGKDGKNPQISITKDTLVEAASIAKRDDIVQVAEYESAKQVITTYLSSMRPKMHPSYNSLVDTGRTSCKGTSKKKKEEQSASYYSINVQNLPKEPGVRECIVAPPGMSFVFADYTAMELAAFASYIELNPVLGVSVMAKAIRAGQDLHVFGAAMARAIPYEELLKRVEEGDPEAILWRTFQKIVNFGALGYMFPPAMAIQAKSWGIDMDIKDAEIVRDHFLKVFNEAPRYFSYMEAKKDKGGKIKITLPSGRTRGNMNMNEACNNSFQGISADAAKSAMWEIDKARYLDEESPLFGLDCPFFIHDEFGMVAPIENIDEVSKELARLMQLGASKHFTVPTEVEASASTRWCKKMKPVYNDKGELQIWKPKKEWLEKNIPDLPYDKW